MPVLNDELIGEGIEYVTLEECRLIADENLVPEQVNYNVDGITGVSDVRHSMPNTSGVKVLVQPLFVQPGKCKRAPKTINIKNLKNADYHFVHFTNFSNGMFSLRTPTSK